MLTPLRAAAASNLSDVALPPLPPHRLRPHWHRQFASATLLALAAAGDTRRRTRCHAKSSRAHYVRKSYRKGAVGDSRAAGRRARRSAKASSSSIIGPSGCGKSTLLHLLGTLDAPDAGEICFEGNRIDNLPAAGRDILRNRYFGMIFQFYHLLPELTTLENVLAPAMIGESVLGYWRRRRAVSRAGQRDARAGRPRPSAEAQAARALRRRDAAGGDRPGAGRPARACCWPTSRPATSTSTRARKSWRILRRLNREQNLTIVMVTHDPQIADQADRTVTLVDGRVVAA